MNRLPYAWHRRITLIPRWGGGSTAGAAILVATVTVGYTYLFMQLKTSVPAKGDTPLAAMCGDPPVHFSANAHYSGSGSHPVAVYQTVDQRSLTTAPARVIFDDTWDSTAYARVPTRQVQLVGCAERTYESKTSLICRFAHGSAPLYHAVYRVRLLEAATGRIVTQAQLRPRSLSCPQYVFVNSRYPKVFTAPSPEEYADVLSRYCNGPVQHSRPAH